MKHILTLLLLTLSLTTFAQKEKMTREEKDDKNAARTARVSAKNDYSIFRKQMMALKEFDAERQKIPALRKASKMTVKVSAIIDSNDNDEEGTSKTLVGYIRQDVGENSTNMYDITFDRQQKKIITVHHTQEAIDADRDLMDEMQEKGSPAKPGTKAGTKKKSKDGDDDDDDEPKPVKGHPRDKDDD